MGSESNGKKDVNCAFYSDPSAEMGSESNGKKDVNCAAYSDPMIGDPTIGAPRSKPA